MTDGGMWKHWKMLEAAICDCDCPVQPGCIKYIDSTLSKINILPMLHA